MNNSFYDKLLVSIKIILILIKIRGANILHFHSIQNIFFFFNDTNNITNII